VLVQGALVILNHHLRHSGIRPATRNLALGV
jgi:hypothetical protein